MLHAGEVCVVVPINSVSSPLPLMLAARSIPSSIQVITYYFFDQGLLTLLSLRKMSDERYDKLIGKLTGDGIFTLF